MCTQAAAAVVAQHPKNQCRALRTGLVAGLAQLLGSDAAAQRTDSSDPVQQQHLLGNAVVVGTSCDMIYEL